MTRLRVVVADDELTARKRLVRLLEEMADIELVGVCEDAKSVLARVKQGGVDAILLDVQMPGLTGLDAVAMMPAEADSPYIIFCTVDAGRLHKALERARARRSAGEPRRPTRREPEGVNRLAIATRQGIVLVDPEEVTHAILEDELVTLFTRSGKFLTDFTLQQLHERLEAHGFERVHRRALLHLGRVTKLVPLETGGFVAEMQNGGTVELSRQSARAIRRRLGLRRASEDGEDD
jgi:two-component system, LytTR family, response regulator